MKILKKILGLIPTLVAIVLLIALFIFPFTLPNPDLPNYLFCMVLISFVMGSIPICFIIALLNISKKTTTN